MFQMGKMYFLRSPVSPPNFGELQTGVATAFCLRGPDTTTWPLDGTLEQQGTGDVPASGSIYPSGIATPTWRKHEVCDH